MLITRPNSSVTKRAQQVGMIENEIRKRRKKTITTPRWNTSAPEAVRQPTAEHCQPVRPRVGSTPQAHRGNGVPQDTAALHRCPPHWKQHDRWRRLAQGTQKVINTLVHVQRTLSIELRCKKQIGDLDRQAINQQNIVIGFIVSDGSARCRGSSTVVQCAGRSC